MFITIFKILIWGAKNFLFPASCALCACSLTVREIHFGLCEECRGGLFAVSAKICNLCGKPLVSEIEQCLSCRNDSEKSYDRLWVIFPYTGKYQKLLSAYKFKKNLALANFFAEKIMETISANPVLQDVCIVAVPPRPGKIKHTGWDQVDHLVRRLRKIAGNFTNKTEKGKGLKTSRCLKRRKSKVQKHLARKERLDNLKGRIFLHGKAPKTAIVIDDVMTTGSTMEVCSAALKNAGTQKVYGLCLFYD